MIIQWAHRASADFGNIVAYTAETDPVAASRVASRIDDAVRSLVAFPHRGRPGKARATRELVLAPLPWIIVYQVSAEQIEVLRILHGAQQWTPSEE